jgi:intergrase/recombinase/post-segregation antitoxin (ccd killing protein)
MKVRTSILIEKEILEKAKKLGINISKFTENALKQAINALTNLNTQTNQNSSALTKREVSEPYGSDQGVLRAGFEPASPARKNGGISGEIRGNGAINGEIRDVDWEGFQDWLMMQMSKQYAKDSYSYARKYADCLFNRDLTPLLTLRPTLKTHVVKALSNLAKYLGMHDEFLALMRKYSLGWSGKSSDELVIERFTRVKDPDEVFKWIKQVKDAREDLADFMDYIAVTGLRLDEAVKSYNLIIKLARQGKLNQYYNEQMETLEHYRLKRCSLGGARKFFVSFVPKELIERIALNNPIPTKYAVQAKVKRMGLPVRFADVREAHASFLTKHLSQPEIDFIHGRVTANVFMSNYFNPKFVPDLKARVSKAIMEIQNKIA